MALTTEQKQAVAKANARLRIQQPAEVEQTAQEERLPPKINAPSDIDLLHGFGEVALTMGTGAVAEIAAGTGGIVQAISSYLQGDDDPLHEAEERIDAISEGGTFIPRTREGKDALRMLGIPFEKFFDFADKQGQKVLESTGSPAAASAVRTSILSAPDLIGLKGARTRLGERGAGARLEQEAQDIGLELRESPDVQRQQIIEQSRRETGQRTSKGFGIEQVQSVVQDSKQAMKTEVNNLYELARSETASLPVNQAKRFKNLAETSLRNFDIDDMPIVKRRLAELDKIDNMKGTAGIKLNEIENFRQRLNRNKPTATDTRQQAAIGIIKGQLDEFMENQFHADMINGSPQALKKWQEARKASQTYKERFKDNRVIRQLAEQNVTPEEMRAWVFGASKVGFSKQSGSVVKRLKQIVGEDSPQFTALRQDALLNVLDPILKENPNFKQFARVYDDLVKNNPTIVDELFPDSKTELAKLRKFADAIDKNPKAPLGIRLEQSISRALVGHEIAQAGLRVTLFGKLLEILRRQGDKTQRSRIMGEILGYDPNQPIIGFKPALIGGGVQTGIEAEDISEREPPRIRQ